MTEHDDCHRQNGWKGVFTTQKEKPYEIHIHRHNNRCLFTFQIQRFADTSKYNAKKKSKERKKENNTKNPSNNTHEILNR